MSYPLISIIVPVYKVEPYLSQCVDSLIHQTYPHLEIILVDDGSPDNCGKICDDYAAKDSRIKVIHQYNQGLSAARNTGLSHVSGQYIMFVDSDDWIDKDTCEVALHAMESYATDLVMWSYAKEYGPQSQEKLMFWNDNHIFQKNDVRDLIHRRLCGLSGSELKHPEYANAIETAWGKLYRASILLDNNILFIDTKEIGTEDALFNLYAVGHVNKAIYLKHCFNHYRKINSSSVTSSYNPQLFSQWQHLFDLMDAYIVERNLPASYSVALNNRIALSLIGLGLNIVSSNSSSKYKICEIRKILDTERYRNAYKQLQYQYFPLHWKVFFIFAKLRFSLGVYILLLAIRRIISK